MSIDYPRYNTNFYSDWVGKTVCKKSKRPFSNGEKEDIVTGIEINPDSGKPCFTLKESKLVDCFICRLVE